MPTYLWFFWFVPGGGAAALGDPDATFSYWGTVPVFSYGGQPLVFSFDPDRG